MKNIKKGITTFFSSIALFVASPVVAETEVKIDYDTPSFQDKELISGTLEVSVKYDKIDNLAEDIYNLRYQIYYKGILQVNSSAFTRFSGGVSLKDLDGNGIAEVVITTFSGGAHCCTNFTIYTWQNNQFSKIETGLLDSDGGAFQDLDGDGLFEFNTSDNSFLYTFSSYAGSFPPSKIYAFRNGKFENVTRKYVKQLKSRAWEMYQAFLQNKSEPFEVNGILAGYVAQKALLGEYQQGWEFMLANYDRTSGWGLAIYRGDREVGKYQDFPTALESFLIEQGYLDRDGTKR